MAIRFDPNYILQRQRDQEEAEAIARLCNLSGCDEIAESHLCEEISERLNRSTAASRNVEALSLGRSELILLLPSRDVSH